MERYQVFVSSTYTDLIEERLTVLNTLMSSNYFPVGMELFYASNDEQFEYIKRVIDDSDYYVLIVGGRYGSVDEKGTSYTEKEYDYAISKGIPVLAFLHENPKALSVEMSEIDAIKRDMLKKFIDKVSHKRLISKWNNKDQLARLVMESLNQCPRPKMGGWVRKTHSFDNVMINNVKEYETKIDPYPTPPEQLIFRKEIKNLLPWAKIAEQTESELNIFAWSGDAASGRQTRNLFNDLLNKKVKINFLILDSEMCKEIEKNINMGPVCAFIKTADNLFHKDISSGKKQLLALVSMFSEDQKKYFKIRETNWFMAWSGIAIDPEKPHGIMQVENYLYNYSRNFSNEIPEVNHLDYRPNLLITRKSEFFMPYYLSFKNMWSNAKELKIE